MTWSPEFEVARVQRGWRECPRCGRRFWSSGDVLCARCRCEVVAGGGSVYTGGEARRLCARDEGRALTPGEVVNLSASFVSRPQVASLSRLCACSVSLWVGVESVKSSPTLSDLDAVSLGVFLVWSSVVWWFSWGGSGVFLEQIGRCGVGSAWGGALVTRWPVSEEVSHYGAI